MANYFDELNKLLLEIQDVIDSMIDCKTCGSRFVPNSVLSNGLCKDCNRNHQIDKINK